MIWEYPYFWKYPKVSFILHPSNLLHMRRVPSKLGSVLLRPMSNWDVKARFTEMSFSYQYCGSKKYIFHVSSMALFLQNACHAIFCQMNFTFCVKSVDIQSTLTPKKSDMEPPTTKTSFEEDNLHPAKTNMAMENPGMKMYFLLIQC